MGEVEEGEGGEVDYFCGVPGYGEEEKEERGDPNPKRGLRGWW